MKLVLKSLCTIWLLGLLASCASEESTKYYIKPIKSNALKAVAVEDFATNAEIQKQILSMPFLLVQERLGTFRLKANSTIMLAGGIADKGFEQKDTYALAVDLQGNYEALVDTPHSQIAVLSLAEYDFSRINDGQMHRVLKREVASEKWSNVIFASRLSIFEFFTKGLFFTNKEMDEVAGREALKFNVSWDVDKNDGLDFDFHSMHGSLATMSRAVWRDKAIGQTIEGAIWLDRASGVWSKAELNAKLMLEQADKEPMAIEVRYDFVLEDIAERITFELPEKWREKKNLQKQLNPLAFFKEHMPVEETDDTQDKGK